MIMKSNLFNSTPLMELQIYPIIAIIIYTVVLIIVAILLWSIDWQRILRKENKTHFIVLSIYILAVLCVTFLVGSLIIFFSAFIGALI